MYRLWLLTMFLVFWHAPLLRGGTPFAIYHKAWQATGATLLSTHFNAFTTINHQFLSQQQLEVDMAKVATTLGQSGWVKSYKSYAMFRQVVWQRPREKLIIQTVRLRNGLNQPPKTLLVVDRTVFGPSPNFRRIEQEMGQLFLPFVVAPRFDVSLVGAIPNRLNTMSLKTHLLDVFSSLKGHMVEGITHHGLASLTGLVPGLSDQVVVAGRPLNLQIAASYDAYHHRTQITLGSPLIDVTY